MQWQSSDHAARGDRAWGLRFRCPSRRSRFDVLDRFGGIHGETCLFQSQDGCEQRRCARSPAWRYDGNTLLVQRRHQLSCTADGHLRFSGSPRTLGVLCSCVRKQSVPRSGPEDQKRSTGKSQRVKVIFIAPFCAAERVFPSLLSVNCWGCWAPSRPFMFRVSVLPETDQVPCCTGAVFPGAMVVSV